MIEIIPYPSMPALLSASLVLLLHAPSADPFRKLTFDDALAAASREKKLVVVDFHSAKSEASKRLEKMTIAESGVRNFLKSKVVAIRVDLASAEELAARFRVESAPTLLFVDAQGLELDRYVGFLEPRRFLEQARGTLAGKDGIARARAKITAGDKNPRTRLELAELLIGRGKHEEALGELLLCFDRGALDDPTFAEARWTEVLTRIHRLGQVWPDALTRLAERSDAAARRIVAGSQETEDIELAIRIDVELGRVERLLNLYDALRSKPEAAEARKRIAPHVVVVLLADHRYAAALEAVGDPAAELEKRIAACAEAAKDKSADIERCRREAVSVGAEYFEIVLGAGQSEKANAIVDRLLAFEPRVGTYEKLMDHAVRASQPKKAAEIGRRGVDAVTAPADKARLRVALSELPER
ncbi:MAG: thioredoxin family protein [Planctomycetota bacterium]